MCTKLFQVQCWNFSINPPQHERCGQGCDSYDYALGVAISLSGLDFGNSGLNLCFLFIVLINVNNYT